VSWSIIIPVKRLDEAKSRLQPALTDVAELAFAFAFDTVKAALGCGLVGDVLVVTSDSRVADSVRALGAVVIDDPGGGLNAAVAAGLAATTGPVAVLTGDLPAVRASDLHDALRLAADVPLAMVADRSGSGTTLLASAAGSMHPRFGVSSRELHEHAGHVVLDVPEASPLRQDVDTTEDLDAAILFGVGRATAAVLARRSRPASA
jgi:2-phospho-L-lactate guanylyltransferase